MAIIPKTLEADAMKITVLVSASMRSNNSNKRRSKNATAQILITRKQLKWLLSNLKASRDSIIANIPMD